MSRPIRYEPDYATRPGEVLEEYLATAGMTKAELATRCGRPMKTISEIIHGKAAITAETALQLQRVLGRPASLWQNLEATYRLRLAAEAERENLATHVRWANQFPIKAMVDAGAIEPASDGADLVEKLLRFFGVGSVQGWQDSFGEVQVAFRKSPSFEAAPTAVSAWIRLGEIEAEKIECKPFDKKRFQAALAKARDLTRLVMSTACEKLVALCAEAGVAVVFVPELPQTRVSGAARWLSKDKALIQLSYRYRSNDHVWFSFFHEAGHILLHGKKEIFIDDGDGSGSKLEEQADRFSRDHMIAAHAYDAFVEANDFSEAAVKRFAAALGIAPGIVVGRLQHDQRIPYSHLNALKERLTQR